MTLTPAHWSRPAPTVDDAFIAAAVTWAEDAEFALLGYVWAGYDRLAAAPPVIDTSDLERSITEHLDIMIRDVMSGDEPFYLQHSPFERETMLAPPAQPPAYDLAFVFRADPRVMWPLEAKVLPTPGTLADYLRDIRDEYLTCRYAPFSPSAAMLGYLLEGSEQDTLANIARQLSVPLKPIDAFKERPCAVSAHDRTVPPGKLYPSRFACHHIILPFLGLRRHAQRRSTARPATAKERPSPDVERPVRL
jgi:hypothetical protein